MSVARRSVPLRELLAGMAVVPADVAVTDLSLDSRKVVPGALVLACAGRRSHGLDHLREVLSR